MLLGYTVSNPYRNTTANKPFYNKRRFQHTYVIGRTGVGKSTALQRWAIDDVLNGEAMAFFDPHGSSIDVILKHIPPWRRNDVVLFDPSDCSMAFNPLYRVPEHRKAFVASSIVDTFRAIWSYSWGPQLEQFLYNGVRALLDTREGTLVHLKYLLTSKSLRKRVVSYTRDPVIRSFWETDFSELMPEREQRERTLSTLNKIGALIADPAIRNCIGQYRTALNLDAVLAEGTILLVRLPQGRLGIEKSSLIGALFMSQLHLAALGRTTQRPFHVYADECHHFGNRTLIEMLSGIRKFHVSLTLAHQYLDQLTHELRAALLGTVGTMVTFRVGVSDAQLLAPDFRLTRDDEPLTAVPPFHAYAQTGGETFLLHMPPPDALVFPSSPRKIRAASLARTAPKAIIEERIARIVRSA